MYVTNCEYYFFPDATVEQDIPVEIFDFWTVILYCITYNVIPSAIHQWNSKLRKYWWTSLPERELPPSPFSLLPAQLPKTSAAPQGMLSCSEGIPRTPEGHCRRLQENIELSSCIPHRNRCWILNYPFLPWWPRRSTEFLKHFSTISEHIPQAERVVIWHDSSI